ncbi:WD repeat-containing protein 44 isoform X2 [Macrosteles quadrilineatus]|uniref:WD repeat-containing protein 44 isoform X2 n=1 Tax=Macrosteles quadrilineatus TaxID=74068 RepID=UPI0023E13653|nr:WD repeat-containing protein 44 isoform X2 [Macrosteles quadrilineatus]
MSGSSDSEEFYDAEDLTPSKTLRRAKGSTSSSVLGNSKSELDLRVSFRDEVEQDKLPSPTKQTQSSSDPVGLERLHQGRRRFRELRQRMQTDDEEGGGNTSPADSQTSSVEGVFAGPDTSKASHPFRIIEHDALSLQSMTSLGRVGRLLSGTMPDPNMPTLTASSSPSGSTTTLRSQGEGSEPPPSHPTTPPPTAPVLAEPDVIASTKPPPTHVTTAPADTGPVAPPRRKKKSKPPAPPTDLPIVSDSIPIPSKKVTDEVGSSGQLFSQSLPSPATTIESLTREFEHSLDIHSAIQGQYVVKPQDEAMSKAGAICEGDRWKIEQKTKLESRSSAGRNSSTYPLGSLKSPRRTNTRERRRSAGDEHGLAQQLNMFVRTRTDSGKQLSDAEILEQVTVLNLDTGERVPLSIAEDKLPQCINPLSLHIMRLTSEYVSSTSLDKEKESDEESVDSKKSCTVAEEPGRMRRKTAQLKRLIGSTVMKTVHKANTIAHKVSRHRDDGLEVVDEMCVSGEQYIKLKASNSHKGPYEFDCLQHVQDLEHVGPVWCMKFSQCGRLLATAGQDKVLRIWVVRDAYTYFQDMRTKYNAEKVSPTPSQESLVSQHSAEDPNLLNELANEKAPFMPRPFCTYTGHTSDLLDVSWSKNYFVLSSSMDKTVRLWHISRKECLCCFQHIEFVTAIAFHPRDDRYFLSGSLDGKLRLWNIPDKKVAVWNEIEGQTKLITAANFCQNGKFAVVGSYDGRCIFYNTDQLKYHTQIHVRSTRGKNSTGRKISGIEPMPGEDKILVTSNDSRIRLYDLRDLNVSCKYKGYANFSSQIKASFSHDGKYIISGSENQCIYIWKTHHDYSKFSSVRRDRNDFWEGIKVHNAVVTCAVFAPNPDVIIRQLEGPEAQGYVLVSADFNGSIKVFLNKTRPKHSSLPASALA